ncbi:MAG: hypothetical protein HN736_05710 [Anaerolineae bacterium]|jgi:hypothetical protein|nr:hypothetical protein [Anaerolineae bacterium]MBT3714100.1 hypothetical protein [Anaerolineae bacterium]MBT4311032.1 hypothetical protein [Anaerolineae bacterium]MBT4842573.1 hypothetical protein [Anaerolineae bacterium]MBT6060988.1 hypothetical protein [Anaerolineae bacterium]
MKKKYLFPLVVILIIFTLACSLFNPEILSDSEAAPPEEAPAESTSKSVPVGGPSDNPCNNVFYPLVPGSQLVYKTDTPEGESQIGITVASVDGSEATVDMLDISTGFITQSTISCDAGAIKQYPLVTMDTIFGDMVSGTLNMDYVSGVIAPAEETLVSNNWNMAWVSEYIMNGEMTFSAEGETTNIVINDSPVVMNWSVISTGQTITVPAGIFTNIVEVKREMSMEISMDMGVMMVDSTLILESTHWFEPYLGMVKMTVDSTNVQYQSMTFPIASDETMELIEFNKAE